MANENTPNKVYKLSSASKQSNTVLQQNDTRKAEFEALQNRMISELPQTGREILITQELYDSNILKGDQKSKEKK